MFEHDDGGSQQQMIIEKIMELLSQLPDKEDMPKPDAEPKADALMVVADDDALKEKI